jgi:hypothetical protein
MIDIDAFIVLLISMTIYTITGATLEHYKVINIYLLSFKINIKI